MYHVAYEISYLKPTKLYLKSHLTYFLCLQGPVLALTYRLVIVNLK